jgi:3-keto-disaccharide hydrolase
MKRWLWAATAIPALVACAQLGLPGTGWKTLIDGDKGLENFQRVGDANWRTEDGAIVADRGTGGFLMSKDSYRDFELRIEFWAADNANSGIYMRCADGSKPTDKTCHEANIFDQRPDQTYATGGIVHIGKVLQPVKAGGKWNVYDITAKGPHITVVLNGVKTAEVTNAPLLQGPVGLQYGTLPPNNAPGGAIKFRKVQIRPL